MSGMFVELLKALKKIDRPAAFCASGKLSPIFPGLAVAGVGIPLPLDERRAKTLKKHAHQAPYGKGERTIVDTKVRRVWEIDAAEVEFENPDWKKVEAEAVERTKEGLGLKSQTLTPHLYKLLLYEKGSFFVPHRDGEKLDRMVATLVLVLPSAHRGGQLVVRHEGKTESIDFGGPDSAFDIRFAAFYADCEHEIRPVTSGYRLALVYNLTLAKSKRSVAAPKVGTHVDAVARILERGFGNEDEAETDDGVEIDSEDEDEDDGFSSWDRPSNPPTKMAVLLDHKYTAAGLTRDALKGTDRAKADILFAAAEKAGYDAGLALATYWQTGSVNEYFGYGHHHDVDETGDEDWQIDELIEDGLSAEGFTDAAGKSLNYGVVPLEMNEIVSDVPFQDRNPDRQEREGYTGNEGLTLERWYHSAAIVLWPTAARFDVLCEGGTESAVGGLSQSIADWKVAGKDAKPKIKEDCLRFARRILQLWRPTGAGVYRSSEDWHSKIAEPNKSDRSLLKQLVALADVSLIADWIRIVLLPQKSFDPGDAFGRACSRFGWRKLAEPLHQVFAAAEGRSIPRDARLLADLAVLEDEDDDHAAVCVELAEALMGAVERWKPVTAGWESRVEVSKIAETLPNLVKAFVTLGQETLLDRLVHCVLDQPREFELTAVQIAAALSLEPWLRQNLRTASPSLRRWFTLIREELESRVAAPPERPTDWRREANWSCKCADCAALREFLRDPDAETYRLPLAQDRRAHLHQTIDAHGLDTTHQTERRGRPYTLVFKKTVGSHDRAVAVHRVDTENLAKIRKLAEWHGRLGD
jgi:2OG-Fe(II) oxygenase superfamily